MRDGDLFRWCYKKHVVDKNNKSVGAGTLYWCCSKIAIYKNGKIRDTYWSTLLDGRSWTIEDAEQDLNLTFLANIEDIEITEHPQYYNPKDVVDISHKNLSRGGVYILKGAKRSKSQMIALINKKIADEIYSVDRARLRVEFLKEKLIDIETADLEKFYV